MSDRKMTRKELIDRAAPFQGIISTEPPTYDRQGNLISGVPDDVLLAAIEKAERIAAPPEPTKRVRGRDGTPVAAGGDRTGDGNPGILHPDHCTQDHRREEITSASMGGRGPGTRGQG